MNLKEIFKRVRRQRPILDYHRVKMNSLEEWHDRRKKAYQQFRQIFRNVEELSKKDFLKFLDFKENKSWTQLYRMGTRATENLDGLKRAIEKLLDESENIEDRINDIVPTTGSYHVRGMGKHLTTAILHVCFPDKYAVWNNPIEDALERIGRLPRVRGSEGDKYREINDTLKNIGRELEIDLIEVDAFIWWTTFNPDKAFAEGVTPPIDEKALRNYLSERPELIEEGLTIVEDGVEYATDVGRIDLLCEDRDQNLAVVELKGKMSSDKAVGQISRYMGWVSENLAEKDKEVRGIIISHQYNQKLDYAVKSVPKIDLKYYKFDIEIKNEFNF